MSSGSISADYKLGVVRVVVIVICYVGLSGTT